MEESENRATGIEKHMLRDEERSIINQPLRSDEVQDIIGSVPHWLVRSGISLIGFILLNFLVLTWFVRYPDVLQANVLITTDPAPIVLVTRAAGPVLLLKQDQEHSSKGEIVAVIQSPENWNDVLRLEQNLAIDSSQLLVDLELGSLQDIYNEYCAAKGKWELFLRARQYEQQIFHLENQIDVQKKLKSSQKKLQGITKVQYELSKKQFETDSILYVQAVHSKLDFMQKKNDFLLDKREYERSKAAVIDQEVRIAELESTLGSVILQEQSERSNLSQLLTNNKNELLTRINQWKNGYLLVAPQDGILSYLDILHDNKYVKADQSLFSIIPEQGKVLAIASMSAIGAGKVAVGQSVNIKLDNYPYEQYGMLVGTIKSISLIPVDGRYNFQLEIQENLTTTYGKKLNVQLNLTGQTEIITEELRLLERIFHWIRLVKYKIQNS